MPLVLALCIVVGLVGCAAPEPNTWAAIKDRPLNHSHLWWDNVAKRPMQDDKPTAIMFAGPCGTVVQLPHGVDCRKVAR